MKKIFNILLIAAATIGLATSCSDVPMPYDINAGETTFGKKLPYKNASLSTFSTYDLKANYPAWSQGSNYTQATGYQAWDGGTKSNVEVESYLISPALNTSCASGKVRISFDQTLRYTNNVSGWKNNHKIFISKNYSGNPMDFEDAVWTELNFTPEASPYSDWTLYNSGYINVPEEFVNHDSVYVAFYFYAPSSASTTWELENFLIEEGEAINDNPGGDTNSGTKDAPLSVAEAKSTSGKNAYVSGYIVGYIDGTKLEEGAKFEAAAADETEVLLSDDPNCTDPTLCFPVQLPVGDLRTALNPSKAENIGKKVTVYGSIETYFGTTGMKGTSWALLDGESIGKDPDAGPVPEGDIKGSGTEKDPYNAMAAIKFVSGLAADTNSDPVYIEGIVCDEPNIDTSYGNATFHISDDGTSNNQFYVFRTLDIGNQKFTDSKKFKKGDKVVIYGPLVNYKGNTPETVASKTYLISINGNSEGGNTGGNDDKPSTGSSEGLSIKGTTVTLTNIGTTAGTETVTVDFSTLGYENAADVTTVELSDGSTIVFAAGTNKNAPKYYSATNGIRVYANNTITFNGKKQIANVVMECDAYNGTDYVGNITATIEADGNKLTYTNASESAGTQLRVKTITITYTK